MIKIIKVKKSFRLDELIRYVWDNDFSVRGFMGFRSDCDNFEVRASTHMLDYVWDNTSKFSGVPRHATFTVEVEEPITEDTVFNTLVDVNSNDEVNTTKNVSVGLYAKEQTKEIHALIDGKLQLIWEADSDEL